MSASVSVAGLLITSTGSAILRKVLFQIKGAGLHQDRHTFTKPWFTTWESALSCWVSLIVFWIIQLAAKLGPVLKRVSNDSQQPLLADDPPQEKAEGLEPHDEGHDQPAGSGILVLIVPGAFSVMSILLQGMGLQYISASLSMMLSGSCVIFTAILSIFLLKRRLNVFHTSGVVLTVVGIGVVSVASLVWPQPDMAHHSSGRRLFEEGHLGSGKSGGTVLGISLTLLSMLVLAGRLVAEEFALRDSPLHPLQVLGYEGMWGTILVGISLFVVWKLPGSDTGSCEENLADTVLMLWNSRLLNGINWGFFLSVVGLNITGLMVTNHLGSVFRAVLLTSRTALVWGVDLILFYLDVGGGTVGESWSTPASYLQLSGFILLLLGTIIYAQGSSAIAQAWTRKQAEDPEDDQRMPGQVSFSEVTRLRPYTSLYIPPGSHGMRIPRQDGTGDRRYSQSLPRDALRVGTPLSARPTVFRSHSFTPGAFYGGAGEAAGNGISTLAEPIASSSASPDTSPQSASSNRNVPNAVVTPTRGSAPLGQSPNLFLETLTHRSSWVTSRGRWGEGVNRHTSNVSLQDYDLHPLEEGHSPASSSLEQGNNLPPGQDIETAGQTPFQEAGSGSLKQELGHQEASMLPPQGSLSLPRRSLPGSTGQQGERTASEQGEGQKEQHSPGQTVSSKNNGHGRNGPGSDEGPDASTAEEGSPSQSNPFADALDRTGSSGSSNPPESRATGVPFGQSPAPDLLLLRRSNVKSKPELMPAFSEEEVEEEDDHQASLLSHQVVTGSDSDLSQTSSRQMHAPRRLLRDTPEEAWTENHSDNAKGYSLPDRTASQGFAHQINGGDTFNEAQSYAAESDSEEDAASSGVSSQADQGEEAVARGGIPIMRRDMSAQWNDPPMSL